MNNVHVDDSYDPDATELLDLLDSLGLCQHVTQSTHELGTQLICVDNVKSN